jgi:hypothetical protein
VFSKFVSPRLASSLIFLALAAGAAAHAAAVGPKIVCNGDPRYGLPRFDVLQRRTLSKVKSWLGPQLAKGPIEVGIAGDMDVEAVIALSAETLGTLPSRPSRSTLPDRPVHPTAKASALARKYLGTERAFSFLVTPKS